MSHKFLHRRRGENMHTLNVRLVRTWMFRPREYLIRMFLVLRQLFISGRALSKCMSCFLELEAGGWSSMFACSSRPFFLRQGLSLNWRSLFYNTCTWYLCGYWGLASGPLLMQQILYSLSRLPSLSGFRWQLSHVWGDVWYLWLHNALWSIDSRVLATVLSLKLQGV